MGGQVVPLQVASVAPGGAGEAAGIMAGDSLVPSQEGVRTWSSLALSEAARAGRSVSARQGGEPPREVPLSVRPTPGGFTDFRLWDLHFAGDGSLWIGLREGEIVRAPPGALERDPAPARWQIFGEADGVSVAEEPRIAHAANGAVWVATEGLGGVSRFENGGWTSEFLTSVGGSDLNTSIGIGKDGSVWVGGFGVIHRYRAGRWRTYQLPLVGY